MSCFLVHHRSQLAAREERSADLPRLRLRPVGRDRLDPVPEAPLPAPGAGGGARGRHGRGDERGAPPSTGRPPPADAEADGRQACTARSSVRPAGPPAAGRHGLARAQGRPQGRCRARAGLAYLADRIIEIAPRIPVRDLATLRAQFPGLGPEELADKLVAGAANGTVHGRRGRRRGGDAAGAARHAGRAGRRDHRRRRDRAEAHRRAARGLRPAAARATSRQRSTAYLTSWTEERGIDVTKPSTRQRRARRPDEARAAPADHEAHGPQPAEPDARSWSARPSARS